MRSAGAKPVLQRSTTTEPARASDRRDRLRATGSERIRGRDIHVRRALRWGRPWPLAVPKPFHSRRKPRASCGLHQTLQWRVRETHPGNQNAENPSELRSSSLLIQDTIGRAYRSACSLSASNAPCWTGTIQRAQGRVRETVGEPSGPLSWKDGAPRFSGQAQVCLNLLISTTPAADVTTVLRAQDEPS